ncbi:MAG: hypothetical protein J2P48_08055 [Alphaproteobacteria bacterium]|nr:hypothetical protein [Alphaproteobacteria bacterium]
MIRYRSASLSLLILLLLSTPVVGRAGTPKKPGAAASRAASSPPERLGSAEKWTAYTYREKTGKVCYVGAEPSKRDPAGANRKRSVAMVTHRPGEKVANVVSFAMGSALKEGSDVALDVGGAKFDLFTKGDSAWARTSELDRTIVEAMAKAKDAVVKGTPRKGPPMTDTYSLAGFAAMLALIDKACDVRR